MLVLMIYIYYWKHVHRARQGSDFLEVWTVMVVPVQLWELQAPPDVFSEDNPPRQVGVELGGVHSDPWGGQGLQEETTSIVRKNRFLVSLREGCILWWSCRQLTMLVQSGMQNPGNRKPTWPGGTAILLVYSRPSSMIPESYCLSCLVTWNLIPEESCIPTSKVLPYSLAYYISLIALIFQYMHMSWYFFIWNHHLIEPPREIQITTF